MPPDKLKMDPKELAKLRADLEAHRNESDALDRSLALLRANIEIISVETRKLTGDVAVLSEKVQDLEQAASNAAHRQTSLRTAIMVTLDFLDVIEASAAKSRSGK